MTTKTKTTWRTVRLGDVMKVQPGFAFKSEYFSTTPNGIPLIRIRDLFAGKSNTYYTGEFSQDYLVKDGDILIGMDGEFYARKWIGGKALLNQRVCRLKDPSGIDYNFAFYSLGPKLREIENGTVGTTVIHLSGFDVEDIHIELPPLSEQEKISGVLSTLDEKIENNNRIIETLEEMAQAIFKEQFNVPVDDLPKGWEVKNVLEVVKRIPVGRKYENKTALSSGKVPILDQGQSGYIGFHNDEPGVEASIDEPVVVFTNHTCNYRLMTRPFSAIQNVLPYVGINDYPTLFVYYLTRGKITMQEYKGHWPEFEQQEFVVPPPALAKEFASFVKPMVQKIVEAENENQKLSAMRDLLLPRLMSGEIRV